MSTIEILATAFGFISVYLTVKENVWLWLTGIVSVFFYIFVFYDAKLYSDMSLQIFYVFIQIYGWYFWIYGGKKKNELPISRLSKNGIIIWSIAAIAGTAILGYGMKTYTNASLPYIDAFQTVLSVIAQWYLTKKIIDTWVLWITVDVVSLGLYLYKGLYLTTGLYAAFLILAIMGLIEWRKTFLKQKTQPVRVA